MEFIKREQVPKNAHAEHTQGFQFTNMYREFMHIPLQVKIKSSTHTGQTLGSSRKILMLTKKKKKLRKMELITL